ncbi:hypothetical protein WAI453_003300 [Rhynchosporium graminicola]
MILPFFLLGYAVIVQSAEYNRMEVFKNVEGCVDQDKFVECYTGNGGVGRKNGVHMCRYFEKDINCFATYCWNKVNTCQYQQIAINYHNWCSKRIEIPYFPTPLNATNDCSCNFGMVVNAWDEAKKHAKACRDAAKKKKTMTGVAEYYRCKCCQVSDSYAVVDAICPKADPYWIGRDYLWETTRKLGFDSLGCDDFILGGHCVEIKFPLSIDKVNKPLTYLAGDYSKVFSQEWKTGTTALITNNPGTLLTPPTSTNVISWWGSRYTHRFDGKVDHEHYTITAASATVALLPEITKAKDSTPTPTTTATFNLSMSHRPDCHTAEGFGSIIS